jgi:hypothetical protein
MEAAVRDRVIDDQLQAEALAFLEQAQDFYTAATARISANPLLLYYAFLNLGKAVLLTIGYPASLERASHGLSERRTGTAEAELDDSIIVVQSINNRVNVYAELIEQLGFSRPMDNDTYPVPQLLPQVVIGHRIWREAETSNSERFVGLTEVEIVKAPSTKELWLRLYVERGDLKRYGITRKRLLEQGKLEGFREVGIDGTDRSGDLVCLEQEQTSRYSGRPSDEVMNLVTPMRAVLWRIVTTTPASGYRKYYVCLSEPGEVRLPQIASLWVLFFYFGSIVRYRPHLFDSVTSSTYGAFVTEFIGAQAEQLLYLLASEMCSREIARPAII